MKQLFIFIFLLLSGNAFADWMPFADNDSGTYYVDMSTKKKVDGNIRIWTLNDYTSSRDGVLSAKLYYEINCKEEKVKFLSVTTLEKNMGEGQVLNTYNQKTDWQYVVPGSVMKHLLSSICN